ncbi:hypothetical protein H6P81_005126 [Aristolochia fimbriata]|uniref:Alpha/beta-Hydrolases superfamily protein n=1 Tax=Aristolochia fimbriata TaxID=158543 RepID=A0AAV7EX59_ARIFI|nr:hypothetical protein H6P81_005126 [Aristolochia fimbriata]
MRPGFLKRVQDRPKGFVASMQEVPSSKEESSNKLVVENNQLQNSAFMPQIFTSVPALSDAATYLAQTTSYLGQCFSNFVETAPQNSTLEGQELTTFSSSQPEDATCSGSQSSLGSGSLMLEHSMTRINTSSSDRLSSAGNISQHVRQQVQRAENAQSGGSMLQSLFARARKTIRGSADDIGWLQREPGMPQVEDGSKRFMDLLDNVRKGVHKLPNTLVYLLVPGLFSNHGPLYFSSTKMYFSKMGLACHIARIHSEASVEKNAREIKEYIEEIYWGSGKRVLLLGHSKGGVDAAAAVSMYWSELKDKVAGIALAQSPYGGSPIASDILREGQLGDYVRLRQLMEILICKVIKGDIQALEDLTYERRKQFLRKYRLPKEIPVISFHTEAGISPAVLATLSQVAHAELPMAGQAARVPVVMPLAAAMAACAQLLQTRYGEKSDGLVTRRDAEVPGSVVVRPDRKLDHAWMVYSSMSDDPTEANSAQVCEALLTFLMEVGQRRRHDITMKDD